MRQFEMRTRGLGGGYGKCLVCGKGPSNFDDFASFVPTKETGESIVNLIKNMSGHARLDYRPSEPKWIQVKICACPDHVSALKHLLKSIDTDDFINADKVKKSLKIKGVVNESKS